MRQCPDRDNTLYSPNPTKPIFEGSPPHEITFTTRQTFSSRYKGTYIPFPIPQTLFSMYPCPFYSIQVTIAMFEMAEGNGCIDEISSL